MFNQFLWSYQKINSFKKTNKPTASKQNTLWFQSTHFSDLYKCISVKCFENYHSGREHKIFLATAKRDGSLIKLASCTSLREIGSGLEMTGLRSEWKMTLDWLGPLTLPLGSLKHTALLDTCIRRRKWEQNAFKLWRKEGWKAESQSPGRDRPRKRNDEDLALRYHCLTGITEWSGHSDRAAAYACFHDTQIPPPFCLSRSAQSRAWTTHWSSDPNHLTLIQINVQFQEKAVCLLCKLSFNTSPLTPLIMKQLYVDITSLPQPFHPLLLSCNVWKNGTLSSWRDKTDMWYSKRQPILYGFISSYQHVQ